MAKYSSLRRPRPTARVDRLCGNALQDSAHYTLVEETDDELRSGRSYGCSMATPLRQRG